MLSALATALCTKSSKRMPGSNKQTKRVWESVSAMFEIPQCFVVINFPLRINPPQLSSCKLHLAEKKGCAFCVCKRSCTSSSLHCICCLLFDICIPPSGLNVYVIHTSRIKGTSWRREWVSERIVYCDWNISEWSIICFALAENN